MENSSEGSTSAESNSSASNIRKFESTLAERIKLLDDTIVDGNAVEFTSVCDEIKGKILDHQDERQLSKVFNNCRRIHIASDLLMMVCSLHDRIVDYEFSKIVNDLLQVEKFKNISRRILRKKSLELKKEKYFSEEASSKIITDLKVAEQSPSLLQEIQTSEKETQQQESIDNEDLSLRVSAPNLTLGNLTDIRGETTTEIPNLREQNDPNLPIREDISIAVTQPEISFKETITDGQVDQDLHQILQVLEDHAIRENIPEVNQPESLLEARNDILRSPQIETEELGNGSGPVNGETEISDEIKLSSLESMEETAKKKRGGLIIDEKTYISNYAARAVRLNKIITVERIQVFEGPPTILQSVSVEYLMKTSGFRTSFFHDKRNEKLSKLYSRNLILEKKPPESLRKVENLSGFSKRTTLKRAHEEETVPTLPPHKSIAIEEEFGEKVGMRLSQGRRDVLSEVAPEMHLPEPQAPNEATLRKSLNGVSLSRLTQPQIEPPASENITALLQRSPVQAQSTKPEVEFHYIKKDAPKSKFREFKYVIKKLQEFWTLLEMQGIEKSITVKEFLALEDTNHIADYLTLVRIFDKMSLQKKVLVEYKKEGIYIRPFEAPFVSSKQLSLIHEEPMF